MICLAYLSSAPTPPSQGELDEILAVSRRNNTRDGVTGLLCHYDGSFLQFLEGEADVVDAAFRRIQGDPRHAGLIEVYRGAIESRAFGEWSMGVVRPDRTGEAERAFATGLRGVEIAGSAKHRDALQPFLDTFRAWMR